MSDLLLFGYAPSFSDVVPELLEAAGRVVGIIRRLLSRDRPLLIALDGGSGSGKSTPADLLAARLDAVVVPGDDFFAADLTAADWERRTPAERARDAVDWRRLRCEALEPLLHDRVSRTLRMQLVRQDVP